jgi:hypothetical protein
LSFDVFQDDIAAEVFDKVPKTFGDARMVESLEQLDLLLVLYKVTSSLAVVVGA